jgi:hypothetical protein
LVRHSLDIKTTVTLDKILLLRHSTCPGGVALRRPCLALALCLLSAPVLATSDEADRHDDCEANFIAAVGADAYQFSPRHSGRLGGVRLFSVLSFQHAATHEDWGRVYWRLSIRSAGDARLVYRTRGTAEIGDDRGTALAEHVWRGRDASGRRVPNGKYRYTFEARFVPFRLAGSTAAERYEEARGASFPEAYASIDEVIVDDRLTVERATELRRSSSEATSCQIQQHAPIEAAFAYNYYYGSTHAHSNYSDGGQAPTTCASGASYGSGTFGPAQVFSYAKDQGGLDFWVINEHNHLINDSVATNNGPVTEAKVRQRYQDGRAAATAATVDDNFVALYGMEWGVSTNDDQGHVTLLETPTLFGWETCTNCNGPAIECTQGTNCYFDVFTPKRFGYLTLYQRSVQNPSPVGALGILAHPASGNFDNFAFDSNALEALQGIAVRSGLAFSTTLDCAAANVGSTDYSGRWREALNLGFRLGPVADHDAHCNNFGVGLPTRTVYLLPNATAPVLTKNALLSAHKARHFFATEDANAQLVFQAPGHIMGDVFSTGSSIVLSGALRDPNGDSVSTIELWRGQVGAGALTAPYQTWSNQTSFSLTEAPGTGTWYYFLHAVQADGHDAWSAPMWITFGSGGGTPIAVGGWTITQANSAGTYTIPAGTTIAPDGYLVLGRNATRAAFETFWGVTLAANVTYLSAADTMPVINGSETYTLANGATLDGPTIAMSAAAGQSLRRNDPCLPPGTASSWTVAASSTATPGSGAATGCAGGVKINEFSDALGTGNFIYEFVELHYDAAGAPADTQPPTTAVTAPASGATVSGTLAVTASASDNVGVASVAFLLDGVVQSTDATTPYSWSWDTSTASNGGHTLQSRATDAAGNTTTSTSIAVTVSNGTDIGGYRIVQANSAVTYTIPSGTIVPNHGYLVVGRSATKAAFESFWGVTLASNVVYLNSAGILPVINGSETYTLNNAGGTNVEGPTIAMAAAGGQSIRRVDPCLAPGTASSWTVATTGANPGSGAGAGCAKGLVINEFSDATGTNNFVYEFVELHNDR